LGDAEAVIELARYQEGPASVVVSRDGDELLFWSSYDDYGRTITEKSASRSPTSLPRARDHGRGTTSATNATAP
jgi:hypothetical protein